MSGWQRIKERLSAFSLIAILLVLWALVSAFEWVPSFFLPSPWRVAEAFVNDFPVLMQNLWVTLFEAGLGLLLSVLSGFLFARLMARYPFVHKALYPLLVLSQTVPTVAIAPLLVLWMGYGMAPKVVLVVLVGFFPIANSLYEGFIAVDPDEIKLLRAMGASRWDIFRFVEWPSALPAFFAGLQVALSYAVVGAVIAEWLGGFEGLGVYMTRVRKSLAYDKMFAVIFLISALSLLLMALVKYLRKRAMPWLGKER